MASSLSTAASASASASSSVKTTSNLPHCSNYTLTRVSFRLSPTPKFQFFSKGLQPARNTSTLMRAQLNEVRLFQWFSLEDLFSNFHSFVDSILGSFVAVKVAVDGSSDAAAASPSIKSEIPSQEANDAKLSDEPSLPALATEESISEFITQVSSLVKLVDSRDIVELQLKQLDCELIIRKKEALPQPASPAPVVMMHPPSPSPPPQPLISPAPPAASPTPSSPVSSAPSQSPSPSASKSQKSSLPPLKCPMAGTFYRSPAPGEPPFVKVGDKVQKGQVLCIIEAMKLMNEIEADQSGTIAEVLVEDCKPVSVDMPLFVIEP